MGEALATPSPAAPSARRFAPVHWGNALVGGSAALLIGTQTAAVLEAGVWAGGHLLHVPLAVSGPLMGAVAVGCVALTGWLLRAAHASEPFFGAIPVVERDPAWDVADEDA